MNGSSCILEDIIFAPQDALPDQYDVGEIIILRLMPVALLLRAEGAKWILPQNQLPALPANMDHRGLFLLRPHSVWIQREGIKIKRTSFPVFDASCRVVCSAQGE